MAKREERVSCLIDHLETGTVYQYEVFCSILATSPQAHIAKELRITSISEMSDPQQPHEESKHRNTSVEEPPILSVASKVQLFEDRVPKEPDSGDAAMRFSFRK